MRLQISALCLLINTGVVQVPLGLLMKNENVSSEMIDILRICHKYVPVHEGKLQQVLFGGDQLTSERSRNGQMAVQDGDTPASRLEGLVCKTEDWHARVTLLQVIFDLLYKEESDDNMGTLMQLKVIANRQVSSDVHKEVAAATEFLDIVTDAYITSAAMDHLDIESLDSTPLALKDNLDHASNTEKKHLLYDIATQIVDTFVLWDNNDLLERTQRYEFTRQQRHDRLPCRQPGCSKTYLYMKCRLKHEQQHHNLFLPDTESTAATDEPIQNTTLDHIYNYSTLVMKLGLLHRNFHDATRENDGDRLAMLWKFLMLLFHHHGHTKYALEGLLLTARLEATLTPRMAELLKWSRTVSTKGGQGNNVPLDLALEYINNSTKVDLKHLGANITDTAARRCSQAAYYIDDVISQLDSTADIPSAHGRHADCNTQEDFKKVLIALRKGRVTEEISGRQHNNFKALSHDVRAGLKIDKLYAWLDKHKKLIERGGGDYLF